MTDRQSADRKLTRRGFIGGSLGLAALLGTGCGASMQSSAHNPQTSPPLGSASPVARAARDSLEPDVDVRVWTPSGKYRVAPPVRAGYLPLTAGRVATAANFGDLYLPSAAPGPLPVIVAIHGGGWSRGHSLAYLDPVCRDIASHGFAVWNIEYRLVGSGGGYPTTPLDVAAAVDHVPELQARSSVPLDLDNVHIIGHSAGGQLAAWAASRYRLPAHAPGARPLVRPRSVVPLAGLFDLTTAYVQQRDRFLPHYLGQPALHAERYFVQSPMNFLPLRLRITAVTGAADTIVHPSQSIEYVQRARRAGDDATLVMLPGVNHAQVVEVTHSAWSSVRGAILESVAL